MKSCKSCTGCIEYNFSIIENVKVITLYNKTGSVNLNFNLFTQFLGMYYIFKTLDLDNIFTKNLKLKRISDKQFVLIRKVDNKKFKIVIDYGDIEKTILPNLEKIYDEFSKQAILKNNLIKSKTYEKDND